VHSPSEQKQCNDDGVHSASTTAPSLRTPFPSPPGRGEGGRRRRDRNEAPETSRPCVAVRGGPRVRVRIHARVAHKRPKAPKTETNKTGRRSLSLLSLSLFLDSLTHALVGLGGCCRAHDDRIIIFVRSFTLPVSLSSGLLRLVSFRLCCRACPRPRFSAAETAREENRRWYVRCRSVGTMGGKEWGGPTDRCAGAPAPWTFTLEKKKGVRASSGFSGYLAPSFRVRASWDSGFNHHYFCC